MFFDPFVINTDRLGQNSFVFTINLSSDLLISGSRSYGYRCWISLSSSSFPACNLMTHCSPSWPWKSLFRVPIFHFQRFILFPLIKTTSPGLVLFCEFDVLLIPCLSLRDFNYLWGHLSHAASLHKLIYRCCFHIILLLRDVG